MTDQPKTDGLLRPYAITDKICAMLSQGVIPWRKPWNVENADPVSLASGKRYRGVNVFMLEASAAMSGYRSRYWVTFKQALERGGNVRKGEQRRRSSSGRSSTRQAIGKEATATRTTARSRMA